MTGDTSERDVLQSLWKEQEVVPMTHSISVIKDRALALERGIERRNVLEWMASGVVLAIFGWYAFDAPNLVARLGALWVMASAVYVAWRLHAHGRMRRPSDVGLETAAYLSEQRESLLAQAKLLRGAPMWYVAPIITGALVFVTGKYLDKLDEIVALWAYVATVAVVLVVAVAISVLNIRAARKLETEALQYRDMELKHR